MILWLFITSQQDTLASALEDKAVHCGSACGPRVEAFASYFVRAGDVYNIDPWLLASIALVESKLDPWAEGRCGKHKCRGIMQVHPANRGVPKFARSEKLRKRCKKLPGACQEEIVMYAAKLLQWTTKTCGSLSAGLGAYNTGKCGRGKKYVTKVQAKFQELIDDRHDKDRRPGGSSDSGDGGERNLSYR